MNLELSGKLIQILPEQTGQGRNGIWRKQEFVIETQEQYPKKVCFNVWGDKIDTLSKYRIGDMLKVAFNIESREWNGKWFTDARAWKIEKSSDTDEYSPNVTTDQGIQKTPIPDEFSQIQDDDSVNNLPF
ncbi:MAG: DUF3127 domain-containing protein [Microscillaceae bacterium]|nr:DUF3127 domain-containing protein [Microscillaceae bacterium]MDW8460834.1 DUF3127 domain-containing protein [Cytophagales bacterium]